MPSLKSLKVRITSVKSTQKITKAMKMVAAAKLRRAQEAAEAARPYAERMNAVLASLGSRIFVGPESPRLLAGTGADQVHLLVVATSERGLAGAFNTNIVRAARRAAERLLAEGKTVKFYLVGKKGRAQLARTYKDRFAGTVDLTHVKKLAFTDAQGIAEDLIARYEAGEFDVAHLFYARFQSALVQEPTEKQIIPVALPVRRFDGASDDMNRTRLALAEKTLSEPFESATIAAMAERDLSRSVAEAFVRESKADAQAVINELRPVAIEYEPDEEAILAELLPRNVAVQLFRALLENAASEQGSRMTAMDNATRNAGDMINRLTITYNRTRQAAITKELIEIISGAEAL